MARVSALIAFYIVKKKEMNHENPDGAYVARSIGKHWPQGPFIA
jgi:hypothetical protein